ncbi:hypothetical protein FOL47_005744, partial [Perkinsus chesapeaki]
ERPSLVGTDSLTPLATTELVLGVGSNRWLSSMSVFKTCNGKDLGLDIAGFLCDHAIGAMKGSEAFSRMSAACSELDNVQFKEALHHTMATGGVGIVGQLLLYMSTLDGKLATMAKSILVEKAESDDRVFLWTEPSGSEEEERESCRKWLSFLREVRDDIRKELDRVLRVDIPVSQALLHYASLSWK